MTLFKEVRFYGVPETVTAAAMSEPDSLQHRLLRGTARMRIEEARRL